MPVFPDLHQTVAIDTQNVLDKAVITITWLLRHLIPSFVDFRDITSRVNIQIDHRFSTMVLFSIFQGIYETSSI